MAYDFYPAMDEEYNFPPEVQRAIARSISLGEAVPDVGTPLGKAIAAQIAAGGGLQGQAGVESSFFAGTFIAQANGTWVLDSSEAGKSRSINIDNYAIVPTFEDGSGKSLRLTFPNLKGKRVVGMQARLDGGGATGYKIQVNSVQPGNATISVYQDIPEYKDYIWYDSAAPGWRAARGNYYANFLNGILTVTHYGDVPDSAKDALSITPRGDRWQYNVDPAAAPTTKNSVRIEIRENRPPLNAFISWDGAKWQSSNPDDIWVNGFLEDTAFLDLGHREIPQEAIERITLTRRGPLDFVVWGGAFPLTRTGAKLEVWRAGNLDRTPRSGDHKFYVTRGGGNEVSLQPDPGMGFFISHGGGARFVDADEYAKAIPGARLTVFGIIEK
jgi:hypothetical protein